MEPAVFHFLERDTSSMSARTSPAATSTPRFRLSFPAVGVLGAIAVVLGTLPASAQEGSQEPWVGEKGITETVAQIMERARLAGDFEPRTKVEFGEEPHVRRDHLPQNPASPAVSFWPPAEAPDFSPVLPPDGNLPQSVGQSFLTTQFSESNFVPPDTVGAVGPTQVLVCSNGRIKVFSKTGVLGGLNAGTNSFFASVLNGSSSSDPQVKYDRLSGRWIVTMINVTCQGNRVMIAVSSGSTITSQSSFTFYFFRQDTVSPPGNTNQFADYPKTGVDANAITIGCNMFTSCTGSYAGATAWVVRKSSVLSGGPIVVTALRGLVPSSGAAGPMAPSGVDNDDPTATVSYVVGVDNASFGLLVLRRINDPAGSPTVSGNLNVTVPSTVMPQSQPAAGSSSPLDALDDRLFACQIHRNRITGVTSLWTAHNIEVNASGVASTSGNRNGSRWYQIDNLATTPTLTQSGTLFDSAASNPRGYWVPSVAASGQGHMALGASYANATVDHPGVATSGRLGTDPLGTIQTPTLAVVSTTNYTLSPPRWGDYSAVMVDPTDDQTLWAFAEYCNANGSWGVRAVQLLAPPPATPTSANPSTLTPNTSNVSVIITGSPASGSGFYDTESGMNRVSAAFGGTGITVNSIAWNSPTQITLDVDVSAGAANGPRSLTVTNPDGQVASSASGIVTVSGITDCNGNGVDDATDIQNGTSQDCDSNGVPDECQPDTDGDGTIDPCDGCPNDPAKTLPGVCGCGVAETDSDGDGRPDCVDGCPNDPAKTGPGQCGCGNPDTDSDGDGTANCNDGCPNDPAKTAPGQCGCGTPDTDSDGDGTANCNDGCPNDPAKIAPGVCGCGVADTDSDGDGTPNCNDGCPNDPAKTAPGLCGCGVADTDSDGDGTPNCNDGCPNDPAKTSPGACGCGVADTDSDGDGTPNCNDGCPDDPAKIAPGQCGCGVSDFDLDADGVANCNDNCDDIGNPGQEDCDGDGNGDVCEIATGAPDCNQNQVPDDCDIAGGTSQDVNGNGIPDSCEPAGVPFCLGDGTGGTCPCSNTGAPGRGCANSTGQSALLTATGTTSPDTVILSSTGELPSAFSVFLQGTSAISPVIYGDGLRCVGGTFKRLYAKNASGGNVAAPQGAEPSVTNRSAALGDPIPSGATRYYLVSYRDPNPSFCSSPPGGTFNATNALSITW